MPPPFPLISQGNQGPQGPAGLKGVKGEKGEVGDKGILGPDGDKGPTGVSGDAGPAGPIGDAGIQVRTASIPLVIVCVHLVWCALLILTSPPPSPPPPPHLDAHRVHLDRMVPRGPKVPEEVKVQRARQEQLVMLAIVGQLDQLDLL